MLFNDCPWMGRVIVQAPENMHHANQQSDVTLDESMGDSIHGSHHAQYLAVRQATLDLCRGLETEDMGLQAMPDVSPPKWHWAHATWFFETFLLNPFLKGYQAFHPQYEYLFNSYYNAIGQQYPRAQRGLLSRPTVDEVLAYRVHVDNAMQQLLAEHQHPQRDIILQRFALGLNHEQQHQELLCTDIKFSLFQNPLYPSFVDEACPSGRQEAAPMRMMAFDAMDMQVGADDAQFTFDNEGPAHSVRLPAFQLGQRLVNNAEFMAFIDAGGYQNPALWLSDGWAWVQEKAAAHPLYWMRQNEDWAEYTLNGVRPLDLSAPVTHVNFYEADAFARWQNCRLPTEEEWEVACRVSGTQPAHAPVHWHPVASDEHDGLLDCFGQVWQWTRSSYAPYPGFSASEGAIGEYNGKFMCNQMVLRGSSCVTPPCHARVSYRNFFYPKDQWQFSGIRLAADVAN